MMRPPSSPRRYLSIWLRRLATDRLRAFSPDEPLVVAHPLKSALRLAAVNDAAARLGLKVGMAVADARAMYPSLVVAESDADADARLLGAVADWCDRYTPLVGLDPPDGVMLDVAGCAHLFGGEAALARDVVQRLAAQGLHAQAAIADTAGCAWGVAHYGRAQIVPPGGMREAMASLPTAALRIAPGIVAALAEVGLKRVADLLDLPRATLAARFGEILLRRIDQTLGREDEPITPRLPLPSYVVEQAFAEPIALERDVLGTIERLAHRLGRAMEQRQDGARLLEAALFRTDGAVHRIRVGTSAPTRDAVRMTRLFADKLAIGDASDPGFGYDLVRLCALTSERCEPVQTGLAAPDDMAEIAHLIDRLGARFGLRRVTRLVPQDTHIPEFAVAAVAAHGQAFMAPFSTPPPSRGRSTRADTVRARREGGPWSRDYPPPQPSPSRGEGADKIAGQGKSASKVGSEVDSLLPARPMRLFDRPEPVEAVAEVPDGPPVRFRWRRVLHEVAAAEGPERIAMEWWRDEEGRALTRDYFRVECRTGLRVWLFREGLYGRETATPRWFLHGLFG